jgi:hypothetical protein
MQIAKCKMQILTITYCQLQVTNSKLHMYRRTRNIILISTFIFLTFLFKVSPAYCQDLEPRAYTNIPVGLNFVVAGYAYSAGGVLFDPAVPLDNANIKIHGTVFAYARSIKIGRMSGKIDMIVPYAWLSGTAEFQGDPVSREVSGFGDSRIRMSVNFIGAPALPLSGFKDYKQDLVVGASLQVFMPTSQYDPDRLVNIGTNRFTFKPELGISKTLGQMQFELTAGAAFYTVNNDFYQGKTRSQDPIGSIQGHVNYNFKKGIWAAIDGTYYWGGSTTVDGVKGNDLQKNTRLGCTLSIPLTLHNSLKLYFSTGVSTRTGSDFTLGGAIWQYRWGGGIPKNKKVV